MMVKQWMHPEGIALSRGKYIASSLHCLQPQNLLNIEPKPETV
jgi:hypothetical protein